MTTATAIPRSAARFDRVPAALTSRDQWVAWKYETRNGKRTKVPYDANTGAKAKADDPRTWASYAQALDVYLYHPEKYDGIGYELSPDDGLTGIDLDHCIDADGTMQAWAKAIIDRLASYTEVTPSNAGIRIFVRGKLPEGRRRKGPVEMYDGGRFLTVTGNHLDGTPLTVETRADELAAFHADTFPPEQRASRPERHAQDRGAVSADDQAIIDKVVRDPKYAALWSGNIGAYSSHSEADLALVGRIAFFVGRDEARIDSIFRQSSLCRAKWIERDDYRADTIALALAGKSEFYSWNGDGRQRTSSRRVQQSDGGRAETLTGYVLVPGPHTTDIGEYIEIGSDAFTAEALGRLPSGSVYRRGGVPGIVTGADGERAFKALRIEDVRIVTDGNMKLGRWQTRGSGEGASQRLCFVPCNKDHGALILAAAETFNGIPDIEVLTSYPIYGPRFELCRPGFHNGIYYDQPIELADVRPESDTGIIREVLDDLVVDFPFRDEPSRQNYFGLLLTPIIHPALDGGNVPAHLANAPLERTGKTKLMEEVLGGVILGRKTPSQQMQASDEEMNKVIVAKLIKGDSLLHLDNIRDTIDSAALASLLTASKYEGRLLGSSRMLSLPNTLTIVATGNNVRATGEIVKRTVPILLQPTTDAPEERRDFVHPDLWGYVRRRRSLVLSCLLGMVENWKGAGRPRGSIPMGGFDQWAWTIGGILQIHGYTEWMGNTREWRDGADVRKGDIRALVSEWHRIHAEGPVTTPELITIARDLDLFGDIFAGARNDKGLQTAFGMRVLARNENMPVADWIIRKNRTSRPALYHLEPLKGKQEL